MNLPRVWARRLLRPPILVVMVLLVLTAVSPLCWAGKFNKVLSVSDSAPTWTNLPGTDGQAHSLADWRAAKAVVLVFICNHCPCVAACDPRIVQLQADYQAKGIQVVAVSVSPLEVDNLEHMKVRAQERGYNFPYVLDVSQRVGRDYGALSTPHVFVLDAQRKIAYMGALDDALDEGEVKQPYVRQVLDALLAGEAPPVTETRPYGCEIDYQ